MTTQVDPRNDSTVIRLAARRVLAQRGDAATLAEIAAEAGMPLDAVVRHYPDRDALVRDLMRTWMTEDGDIMAHTPMPAMTPATVAPPASPAPVSPSTPGIEENRTLAADVADFGILMNPPTMPKSSGGAPFGEILISAVRTLRANKTRSFLTMLGIIIGVAAVISLLAVGNAFTGFLTGQLTASGATTVFINPANQRVNGVATGKKSPSLTLGDANALVATTSLPIDAASPVVTQPGTATGNGNNVAVTITGAWETYPSFTGIKFIQGAMFTKADEQAGAAVVVIGSTVASTLFGDGTNPVGENMQVNGTGLRVVGVTQAVGALGTTDTAVIIPISTAFSRVIGQQTSVVDGTPIVDQILLRTATINDLTPAADGATVVLDHRRPLGADGERDFDVQTVASQLKTLQTVLGVLQIFLATVAAISLLVGGIGIMNIMLVSVTERTREIGIRKAIGAKEGDILLQFLVESGMLSGVGGLIGLAIGCVVALLITLLWRPAGISWVSIAVSLGAALATGIFFGVAPARNAARLKPIDALRSE